MALHRFIHVGDVHLQSSHPRNADRLNALDQIIAHARAVDDLAAFLIPGDLFHAKPTTQDRNDLADRLIEMADIAPVLMVYGNHDEPDSLEIFTRLDTLWPIVATSTARVLHVGTPAGVTVACFAVPYPFKGAMVAGAVEHQGLSQMTRALFDPIFISAADELATTVANGAVPVMIGHLSVGGAVASTGQPQVGHELEIDPSLLARLNVPAIGDLYVGLSHIHKHQRIGTAVYAGSIARLDFAEVEPKGFIEVEYQRDGQTWEHRWTFVRLEVPAMHHVEGRLTRDAFIVTSMDGQPIDREARLVTPWDGADVRCRYRFAKGEVGVLDVARIHAEFAGCRSLLLEPIAESEATVRAPEIAAAVTLEAKVHAFAARQGLQVTPGFDHKLSLLQATSAEAVLQVVSTAAAACGAAPTDTFAVGDLVAAATSRETAEVRA